MNRNDQPRHQKGTPLGGQFASCARPDDPMVGDLAVSEFTPGGESFTTIEAVVPLSLSGTPVLLEQHDGRWEVGPTWDTTEFGLKMSRATTANENLYQIMMEERLQALLRAQAVVDLLNSGDLRPQDAREVLERLDGTWGVNSHLDATQFGPQMTPDYPLSGAMWAAAVLGRKHLLAFVRGCDSPEPDGSSAGQQLGAAILKHYAPKVGLGEWRQFPKEELLSRLNTVRERHEFVAGREAFSFQLQEMWEEAQSEQASDAAPSLDALLERTGLGQQFGDAATLSWICDTHAEVMAAIPSDHYREFVTRPWTPWLLMSKAAALDHDADRFAAWMNTPTAPSAVSESDLRGLRGAAEAGDSDAAAALAGLRGSDASPTP